MSDLPEIWSCKKQKNAGIAHMHTQIHAHCFFPFFFSVCVFVFTAGVPFRSSFRQRYIYWKASLNLNQEIQLKIYFYRPNNGHFCKYFQRSLCYVKASDIKYQANQCYSIMLPNASIGPRPVKKKNVTFSITVPWNPYTCTLMHKLGFHILTFSKTAKSRKQFPHGSVRRPSRFVGERMLSLFICIVCARHYAQLY